METINLDKLLLFEEIRQDEIVLAAVKIFNEFSYSEYIAYMETEYYQLQRTLLRSTLDHEDTAMTRWQSHLCRLVAESENPFSLQAEKGESEDSLLAIAARDAHVLKQLYRLDWAQMASIFHDQETCICQMPVKKKTDEAKRITSGRQRNSKRKMISLALEKESDQKTVEGIFNYYRENGCGIYEMYDAFLWKGRLVGVTQCDPITFDQLVGYEKQKEALIENTAFFLDGYLANNVLLYGDRGTGKSSSVKALLSLFSQRKLKIISLNKDDIGDLHHIIELISGRGCKFIIFIDDLSFEDTETGYKHFKSVIEGGIEAQPTNALLYVTSNRKNIIRETWRDRGDLSAENEVHRNDALQEKLSLADRFGLTITFSAPDKSAYLNIVKNLVLQEGLVVEDQWLEEEALRWELRQHGRSGRSARQFVNQMQARMLSRRENQKQEDID